VSAVPLRTSVIIPTFNRSDLIGAVLESLVGQDHPADAFEIVVVDDGSTDDTADVVGRYVARTTGPDVRLVCQANGGGNRARNAGIRAARGELLAFLDDDEVAPPDHLRRSIELLDAHPEVAGVGGPAIDDGKGSIPVCGRCTIGTAVLLDNEPGRTDLLLTGNMLVRREVFDRVGLFEPSLKGRGEETEWFRRARASFLYEPSIFVWHCRAQFTTWRLCRTQFRYGRGLPRASALKGDRYRPKPRRVVRLLGHAAGRRCANGLVLSARNLGATWEWALTTYVRRRPLP
jgi:glycosyltransferase involved in cell wall biosynthesis